MNIDTRLGRQIFQFFGDRHLPDFIARRVKQKSPADS
jgi:hypothetical protein